MSNRWSLNRDSVKEICGSRVLKVRKSQNSPSRSRRRYSERMRPTSRSEELVIHLFELLDLPGEVEPIFSERAGPLTQSAPAVRLIDERGDLRGQILHVIGRRQHAGVA